MALKLPFIPYDRPYPNGTSIDDVQIFGWSPMETAPTQWERVKRYLDHPDFWRDHKVRRKAWAEGDYIRRGESGGIVRKVHGVPTVTLYTERRADVEAKDWVTISDWASDHDEFEVQYQAWRRWNYLDK